MHPCSYQLSSQYNCLYFFQKKNIGEIIFYRAVSSSGLNVWCLSQPGGEKNEIYTVAARSNGFFESQPSVMKGWVYSRCFLTWESSVFSRTWTKQLKRCFSFSFWFFLYMIQLTHVEQCHLTVVWYDRNIITSKIKEHHQCARNSSFPPISSSALGAEAIPWYNT